MFWMAMCPTLGLAFFLRLFLKKIETTGKQSLLGEKVNHNKTPSTFGLHILFWYMGSVWARDLIEPQQRARPGMELLPPEAT